MVNGGVPPFFRLLGLLLVLLALGACRAEALVELEVNENGVGRMAATVTLDEAAAEKVGDLAEFIAADDLKAAGWRVESSEKRVSISRPVNGPNDINAAFDELTGPDGPFGALEFRRDQGFVSTRTALSGRVDLTAGLAAFGDAGLTEITGSATGVDAPASVLGLTLAVQLPGEEKVNAASGRATWLLPLGQVTEVKAESVDVNWLGLGAATVALLAGAALVAVGLRRRIRG